MSDPVQQFLEDTRDLNHEHYLIIQDARKIVAGIAPSVSERIIYGGIMFTTNSFDFGGLFTSKRHVSFEFSKGFELDDPDRILEGGGKYRRHLKLQAVADIEDKNVKFFVEQAVQQE